MNSFHINKKKIKLSLSLLLVLKLINVFSLAAGQEVFDICDEGVWNDFLSLP